MITVNIPKKLAKNNNLVVVPRKEYAEFSQWKEVIKSFKTFMPVKSLQEDIKKAREDYKKGKYITINELKRKLAIES